MNCSAVNDVRRRLAGETFSKLVGVPRVGVRKDGGPGRRYKVVDFAVSKIRPRSIDDVLSTSNVTIHTKRRYTRPLVRFLNIPSAAETDVCFCGAGSSVSTFLGDISSIEEEVKCKGWRGLLR